MAEQEKKKLRRSLVFAAVWIVLLAGSFATATYAWFTYSASTNVEPMSSTISTGPSSLLISNRYDGPFERSCELLLSGDTQTLYPVSTSDLEHFYCAQAQNRDGIAVLYRDCSKEIDQMLLRGTVYLVSRDGDCDVYFYPDGVSFGSDSQALAALRFGIHLTAGGETKEYIFRLDELAGGAVEKKATVAQQNVVVKSISGSGEPVYAADSSAAITDYYAVEAKGDSSPEAGKKMLCSLKEDEIAVVDYWLYLEGCDENCFNDVQKKDAALQLAFAGVSKEEEGR